MQKVIGTLCYSPKPQCVKTGRGFSLKKKIRFRSDQEVGSSG